MNDPKSGSVAVLGLALAGVIFTPLIILAVLSGAVLPVVVSVSLVGALLAVLFVADRTRLDKDLRALLADADNVAAVLQDHFAYFDCDGDGVISSGDIDQLLEDKICVGVPVNVIERLRPVLPIVGHLVGSQIVMVGCSGTGPAWHTHEVYGISRADISELKQRLIDAIRNIGRKPAI